MLTIGEAIQRVQSLYSKGVQSRDSRLTSRHIYSALITARSILIRQQSNKNQRINRWAYQVLPCVAVKAAPEHECKDCKPSECTVLRTVDKLPKLISDMDKMLFKSVTNLNGNISYDSDSFELVKYSTGNKYTALKPSYYLRNGYLYITVLKLVEVITIEGLFEDPIEVWQFPSTCPCPDCACQSVTDLELPIDRDLLKPMIQIANEELIVLMKQMREDRLDNAIDDTNSGGMVHQPNQQ